MKIKFFALLLIFIFIGCVKQDSSSIKLLTEGESTWDMSYIDVYSFSSGPSYEYLGTHTKQGSITFNNGSGVYILAGKTFNFTYEILDQNYIVFSFDSTLDVGNIGNSAFLDDYLRINSNSESSGNRYKILMYDSNIILRKSRIYPNNSYYGEDKQYIEIFLFNEAN